jgi:hypothetical protein
MLNIRALWRNTRDMPQLLGVFCQGAMVAPLILAVALVLPLTTWTINDRQVDYTDLWTSGAGSTMLVLMLMATAGAWGLAARASWSRWVWVATPVGPLLVAAAYPKTWFTADATSDLSIWLSALFAAAIIFACLFLTPSVRAYAAGRADSDI